MSNKKELFGIDGADHAAYTLAGLATSSAITYFINPYYIFIVAVYVSIGFMIMWFGFEYTQEKAMVDDGRHVAGRHLKPWTWTKARFKDMGYPLLVILIYTTTVYQVMLTYIWNVA